MTTEQKKCPKYVSSPGMWSDTFCGRELTTDDELAANLCKRHLAGKKRADANEARRQKKWDELEQSDARAAVLSDRLRQVLGVGKTAIRGGVGEWDRGRISLSFETVELLLECLEEGK